MGAKKCLLKNNGGAELQGMLDVSKELFNFLIGLAKHSPKSNQLSVKMKRQEFNGPLTTFIPPVQAALSVTPSALDRADARDIFPPFVPRIRAFNPELKIMQSKAKPKKVSMYAVPSSVAQRESLSPEWKAVQEDTGEMHFLVKQEAKGDLRKDSRVQDLNNVINRLFAGRKGSSGSDSRRKRLRLHLRTFSVVCLAEDCGILEWVPNTDSLRSLVGGTYNPQVPPNSIHRRGERITNFNNIELRDSFLKCQDMYFKKGNLIGAAKKFDENILQQYLPIMYWWFIQNFSNPHAWFEARNNFTLSTAVWSAVGHIIGLGDRHSENILLDTRSGECVHVDFDCIFDKGLLLPRPEVIPFRLTPNMIDAFGPTGSDGLYTGALVESMKTLRQNRDTLLSVLEPFLKDPVINFSSSKNQQKSQGGSAKAVESIRKIDGRLKGMYNLENPNYKKVTRRDGFTQDEQDDSSHVALSVVGQVQRMIREATSHENLVQVYVGWMPWI
jgi:serine/threonine-protein kinase ATR